MCMYACTYMYQERGCCNRRADLVPHKDKLALTRGNPLSGLCRKYRVSLSNHKHRWKENQRMVPHKRPESVRCACAAARWVTHFFG